MTIFDDPGLFGRLYGTDYDGPGNPDPAPAVDFLARLAQEGPAPEGPAPEGPAPEGPAPEGPPDGGSAPEGPPGGPVLELAIGTGRVALPLAERGLAVEGIEASAEMVAQLRAKPGGADLPVTIGDMADVPVSGPYPLVYLVFNTLFNLVRAERQADCLRNVARVLVPGGAFVIEAYVPDPADFDRDEQVQVRKITEDSVTLRLHRYDREAQQFIRQSVTFDADGVHLQPFAMRYLWPAQIDELAEAAGLRLVERYADWARQPFGPDSRNHISVYRRI